MMTVTEIREALGRKVFWRNTEDRIEIDPDQFDVIVEAARAYADLLENGQGGRAMNVNEIQEARAWVDDYIAAIRQDDPNQTLEPIEIIVEAACAYVDLMGATIIKGGQQ